MKFHIFALSLVLNQTLPAVDEIYRTSTQELEAKAKSGDPEAAFRLSFEYIVRQNNQKLGFEWLRRAAAMGHPTAQYNLAIHLLKVDPNNPVAMELFMKSAENGNVLAKQKLDEIRKPLSHTWSVEKITTEERKANGGDMTSALMLYHYFIGIRDSEVTAAKWLRIAADLGSAEALHMLGCYWRDHPILRSEKNAIYYFERASKLGHESSIIALKQIEAVAAQK